MNEDPRAKLLEPRHLALLLSILESIVPHAEVWAYGSRVKGTHHETSDLDLAIHCTSLDAEVAAQVALKTALVDSDLPIRVDVVAFRALPPSFQEAIRHRYTVLQRPDDG